MGSPSANFSDLRLAKQLSQRLALGLKKAEEQERPAPPPATYTPFRADVAPAPPPAPAPPAMTDRHVPAAAPARDPIPEPPANIRNWDDMLQWCQEAAFAKSVFVMDSQGFVIAKEGSHSYEDAEAMGTQLMVALDRFDELDTFHKRALSVTVEFKAFWLTGIRVPAQNRDCFTLGVLRADAPPAEIVQEVSREVAVRAPNL